VSIHTGSVGKVRSADIEYKIPGKTKFRVTTRLIHQLVLVVPVEEQTMGEGELQKGAEDEEETDIGRQGGGREGPGASLAAGSCRVGRSTSPFKGG
jgi:hypothetical protein